MLYKFTTTQGIEYQIHSKVRSYLQTVVVYPNIFTSLNNECIKDYFNV